MDQGLVQTAGDGWLWQRLQNAAVMAGIPGQSIVLLLSTWVLVLLIKKLKTGKLQLPPGPRGLPVVGNLLSLDPELHTYFEKLTQIYGPIFSLKLGQRTGIVISSPSLARQVLKEQDTIFANRDVPAAGKAATYGGKDIAWAPHGAEWRMLRKVCVRDMLGGHTLDSMYPLRRKELRQTIKYLYDQSGSPVNVGEQMFLTAMNVVTSMMWGGTIEGKARASVGAEFRQAVTELTGLLGMPNVSDFFPALARFDLQGVVKKIRVLVHRFDDIFETVIGKRLGGGDSRDFLQVLLKLKDEGDDRLPFTMTHLKALLMDMVVGGTETTANTIEFALTEILNKPQVLQKLRRELEETVGNDSIVEESHINSLPYLHAVIKEALRLHPVLPLLIPHCPSSSSVIGGYTVPKGSRVFINVWAVQRDPEIWENPSEFRPERFLDGRWDFSGNDFSYFPFGSGRRICAGILMAERMLLFSIATLVHSFDWSLPAGVNLDLTEKFGIVLKKKTPLIAIGTPRLSDSKLYE